jgi:argininosuccinate lyase
MSKKLWGGRFKESINDLVDRFNESLSFDRRLYAQDIQGSIAHSRMLGKQGIISDNDASRIIDGLTEAKREMDRKNHLDSDLEDVHSLIEKVLVAKVGAAGEKMHTARSRNDQVALDMRMYVRDAVTRVINLIKEMQLVLIDLAEKNIDLIMPGYTHLQPAQPVLVSHHLMAYYEMLKRDKQRFYEELKRVNVLPLGSAALAGTTFDLDRKMVADELEFDSISKNSMDAVSDRDFVIEYIFSSSVLMMHLSRLSEEMILWSTQEFGIINLPDAFCTGSSIMPQKKNPDILELIRGKTGRVYGHLISLLTVMKGLPLTYNKDMQEDKESLFDTVDTVEDCLSVITLLLKEVSFNGDTMKQACEKGYLMATDLADYMVVNGSTFRQAHDAVGKIVLYAIGNKKELHELKLDDMKQFSKHIKKDVFKWLEPASAIKRRNLLGGTGSRAVRECIKQAKTETNS